MDRSKKRITGHIATLLLIFGGCVGTTYAQDAVDGAAVRLGFYRGNLFTNNDHRTHLEGFEIGGDIPLERKAWSGGGIFFSPTFTAGGSNRKGPDTDGNIYHLLLTAKQTIPGTNAYGGIGVGYTLTQARIHEFRNVSGLAWEYLLGYTLGPTRPGKPQPFLEAAYHDGTHAQLRGFVADLGLRF